jgi:murein DD-endopeptidase MepM/ murein hydrolase activator NlpD
MGTAAAVLLALAVSATPAQPAGWPVDDPRLVSGFRPPAADWQSGHRGIDLAARTGAPVRAMAGGVIGFAGSVAGKPVVTVVLAGGARLTYEPVLASVRVGALVRDGTVIGTVAAAGGHCGGMRGCLHVGLRSGADSGRTVYLDPLSLLDRRPAVLKPR